MRPKTCENPSDCLCSISPTQLPQYASTASMFQPPEMASTAPAVASQPGVTNKVSAWLQQTEDIDATSSGQSSAKRTEQNGVQINTNPAVCVSELVRCQAELSELAHLIQRLHWLEGGLPVTSTDLEMRINVNVSHAVTSCRTCIASSRCWSFFSKPPFCPSALLRF